MTPMEIAIVANSLIGSFIAGASVAPVWDDEPSLWWKVKLSLLVIILTIFGLTLLVLGIPAVLWAGTVRLWRILMIKSWVGLWMGRWDNLPAERREGFLHGWNYYKDKGWIGRKWMEAVAKRNGIELN